jgi:ribosomal protein L24
LHSSNVMLLDPKSGEPTRTKARFDTDATHIERRRTKERVSVKNGEPIPRVR